LNNLDKDQILKTSLPEPQFLINFRCPDCSKLYSSDPENIYVENPEYSCTSCETEFTVSLIQALENSEVVGVKKQSEAPSETINLPIQDSLNVEVTAQELTEERVDELINDFQDKASEEQEDRSAIRHADKFELLWQDVLGCYADREAHAKFIRTCSDEGRLEFAHQMYGNILKNNPTDRIAHSFVTKMQVSAEVEAFVGSEKSHQMLTTSFYITLAIVSTGLVLILMGLIFGENKNLAGLGIALIFFTFAVKAFFQPRRPSID